MHVHDIVYDHSPIVKAQCDTTHNCDFSVDLQNIHKYIYPFFLMILEHKNALSHITESTSSSATNHLLVLTVSDTLVSNVRRAQNDSNNSTQQSGLEGTSDC